jgi:hypothetical protein
VSPEELKRKARVEIRGDDGGEMRVLAAADVASDRPTDG